jgi:hypothetical protein
MMGVMSGQPANGDYRGEDTDPGPSPPNPYGLFATTDGLGGVAAPLLAGFAITMIALVVQIADDVRWPDVSLVLLGAAAVLLLQVVQLSARARGYAVTPVQAREWYPDIEQNSARLRMVNGELRHHLACWRDLVRRARARYNLAIVLLLCGITVLLVPKQTAQLTAMRGLAIAVIALGGLIEIAAIVADWARKAPAKSVWSRLPALLRWAAPPVPPVPATPLPARTPTLPTSTSSDHEPKSPPGTSSVPSGTASLGEAPPGNALGPFHNPE